MRPPFCHYSKDQGHLQKKRLIWGLRFQSRWWQRAGSGQLEVQAATRAHILNPRQEAESANWEWSLETSKSAPSATLPPHIATNWGSYSQRPPVLWGHLFQSRASSQLHRESVSLMVTKRLHHTHRGHLQRARPAASHWSRGLTLSQPLAGSCSHRLHQPHLLELVKHTDPAASI